MKVTNVLIIVNVLIFLVTLPFRVDLINEYGFNPIDFLTGKYHILITSLFIHLDISHLIFNMIALFLLGTSLEETIDSNRYILTYFVSGIVGNLTMLIPFLYSPETIGIGASGAISGLVGLGTFFSPGKLVIFPSVIPLPFVVAGALYFLSTALNLFTPSQIGYPVHMIGLLTGMTFGLVWSKNWVKGILIFITTLVLIISLPYVLELIFV
jgi:membrane associated rhomboid family serine protease